MKEFLKYTLATIVGVMVVSFFSMILFFIMTFAIIGSIGKSSDSVTVLKSNSVYQLDLRGTLVERSEEDPLKLFMALSKMNQEQNIGLDDVLANIKKAKENSEIAGIRLNCGPLAGGYASVKEIRDALVDFKASGKFIIAYADNYSQKMYYLASVADQIYLNKIGTVAFHGISSTTVFYKDLLDKLGVEMQVVKVGEFKSAVEPYVNTKMSDANRKQVSVFINSIWKNILQEISESRNISVEQLNLYADEALDFRETEKILEYGLVDQLAYSSDVEDILKEYIGIDVDVNYVKHRAMTKVATSKSYEKNKLAVIYATGGIDTDRDEGIHSEELVKTINEVAEDDNILSVVFRVNSPGGSAYGSEQIWYALSKLKEKKTLIISMGDYAASGGYYIACMGDKIVAQPNTLTGSIGVFGLIPNIEKLSDKIGIDYDVVKTNKLSDAISINRPFTTEEKEIMQVYVNRTYDLFVQRCADGRNMTTEQIKAIAEGRVWTGENALAIGLVDELGNLNRAIEIAAEEAGLISYAVSEYPKKEDFTAKILKSMSEEIETRFLKARLGEQYKILKEINNLENLNGIQARMPYNVELR